MKSDGTAAGTALFADFELGPNSSLPYVLYQDDNLLFLSVGTENQGRELWVVDGTRSLRLPKDIATGPANGILHLNTAYMVHSSRAQMDSITSPRAPRMKVSSCANRWDSQWYKTFQGLSVRSHWQYARQSQKHRYCFSGASYRVWV